MRAPTRKPWKHSQEREPRASEALYESHAVHEAKGFEVFISPHYYYPTDRGWKFGGTIENVMHHIKMFDRSGALSLKDFSGSGADWLERCKPYIDDGKSRHQPHKVRIPHHIPSASFKGRQESK